MARALSRNPITQAKTSYVAALKNISWNERFVFQKCLNNKTIYSTHKHAWVTLTILYCIVIASRQKHSRKSFTPRREITALSKFGNEAESGMCKTEWTCFHTSYRGDGMDANKIQSVKMELRTSWGNQQLGTHDTGFTNWFLGEKKTDYFNRLHVGWKHTCAHWQYKGFLQFTKNNSYVVIWRVIFGFLKKHNLINLKTSRLVSINTTVLTLLSGFILASVFLASQRTNPCP